jgi:hypothetical protein
VDSGVTQTLCASVQSDRTASFQGLRCRPNEGIGLLRGAVGRCPRNNAFRRFLRLDIPKVYQESRPLVTNPTVQLRPEPDTGNSCEIHRRKREDFGTRLTLVGVIGNESGRRRSKAIFTWDRVRFGSAARKNRR